MGASLFTLFFNQGVERGFWTIVIAHTLFCLSFVAMTVKARVRGTDWTFEDAAMDLGSPPLRTFWKITMPRIMPGVAAAFLLSLALSIDDYIITSFVAGPTDDVPAAGVRLGPHRPAPTGARAGHDHHVGGDRDHRHRDAGLQPPPIQARLSAHGARKQRGAGGRGPPAPLFPPANGDPGELSSPGS